QLDVRRPAVALDLHVRAAQLRVDLLLVLEVGAELEGGRDISLERVLDVDFHVFGFLSWSARCVMRSDSSSPFRRRAMSFSYRRGARRLTHQACHAVRPTSSRRRPRSASEKIRSSTASGDSGSPTVTCACRTGWPSPPSALRSIRVAMNDGQT